MQINMKKLLFIFSLISFVAGAQPISQLTTTTSTAAGDFLIKNDAAGGSGATKKVTVANLFGAGTPNYVLKYSGTGTLTNSVMYDNGTNVGIGTTSPAQIFDIEGMLQVNSTGNILKINNVATSWPSSQGSANSLLQNNGSGTFTWSTALSPASVSVTGTTDATSVTTGSLKTLGGLGVSKSAWIGTDLTFPSGVDHIISTEANASGSTAGLTISTGNAGGASGTPGDLYLTGGSGEDISGASVYITGGGSSVANGGTLTLEPGAGTGANGNITIGATTLPPEVSIRTTAFKVTTGTPGVGKVLTDDGAGTGIATWATPTAGTPGGSNTQLQYNNSGAFGGISGATTNGTDVTFGSGNLIATSPSINGSATSTTGTQLNYLNAATGTTGTASTNVVFSGSPTIATPTITTSATVPLLIGGTGTTDDLIYRTTSGSGTTGADHIWQSGNNGATELMRLLNSGSVGVGTATPDVYSNGTAKYFTVQNTTAAGATFSQIVAGTTGQAILMFGNGTIKRGGIVGEDGSHLTFYTNTSNSGTSISEKMRITSGGGVGIGTTSISAVLHLKAGAATASTAPLKFTSGTNLTTAEAGAMEYSSSVLYFTPSGTSRYQVGMLLTGSATLDFASTNAQNSSDLTITVTGAADGDPVTVGAPNGSTLTNSSFSAWVSATNTVTVRFNNYSSGAQDPASGTFKVTVNKN